jgi:hypothetical protein
VRNAGLPFAMARIAGGLPNQAKTANVHFRSGLLGLDGVMISLRHLRSHRERDWRHYNAISQIQACDLISVLLLHLQSAVVPRQAG